MARTWSPEETAELARLIRTDLSWCVIGARLGRTGPAVHMKAVSMGLGPKPYTGNRSPVWSLIQKICKDGSPRTVHELAKLTGATRVCVDRLMHDRLGAGQAHVGKWERQRRGPALPYWLPIPGKSVPRPVPLTSAERQREVIRRMKEEDPLKYKALIDRTVLRQRRKRGVVVQQHPVLQALFGMGAPA